MPRRITIDGHYSRCDICGDGYDRIIVAFPSRPGRAWVCQTNSRCHGDLSLETVDVSAVQQFLSDNEYLMATRLAIRKYNNLLHSIEEWISRYGTTVPTPASAPIDPENHGPEVIAVMPDEMFVAEESEDFPEVVMTWASALRNMNVAANDAASNLNNIRFNWPVAG